MLSERQIFGNASSPAKRSFAQCTFLLSLAGAACLLSGTPHAHAQQTAYLGDTRPTPQLNHRELEPSVEGPYELGRGDQITIDFNGKPELASQQTVGPDGSITLPLAGSIKVADLTRDQAAALIDAALKPYYMNIITTIRVDKYSSNQVLLLGAVEHPGIQSFDRAPTLLEVVTKGGALTSARSTDGPLNAGPYNYLQHVIAGIPDRVAIYRGTDRVIWVELRKLLDSGNSMVNLRLKRDDVVYVPSPDDSYVSVLGEVQHPGALALDSTSTLTKLIAEAGGLTLRAGTYPDIQIVEPATGKSRVISFKSLIQGRPVDLKLQSGDVIYIPQSGFNKFAYSVEKLAPLVTSFTAAAILVQ